MKQGRAIKAIERALLATCLIFSTFVGIDSAFAVDYTITYDANPIYVGSALQYGVTSGSVPSSQTAASGSQVTVAPKGTLARQGFDFAGWNTQQNGSGTTYAEGSGVLNLTSNTTLYALWAVPLAARLIGNGGTMVTVSDPSNVAGSSGCLTAGVRGITSDGTYIYYRSSGSLGYICKTNTTGVLVSVHAVSSNAGVTALASVGGDSIALVYGSGCLFLRKDTLTTFNSIYCIQLSNWTMYSISLGGVYNLPSGGTWLYANFIQFPDGRIGAVSAPTAAATFNTTYPSATPCPAGKYCKLLRLYSVTGTGSSITTAYSTDFVLQDDETFPSDDHGIATDGTYLYQIRHERGYKVWALQGTGISYLVFNADSGNGSCGASTGATNSYCRITYPVDANSLTVAEKKFGNGTYLGRAHALNKYLIGDYSPAGNARFWLSDGIAPPPGPGNPDIVAPSFTNADTFTVTENISISTTAATLVVNESSTFSLFSTTDGSLFTLLKSDTAIAIIKFNAPPDFEGPADVGTNNIYDIRISATDSAGNIGYKWIAVRVTNLSEVLTLQPPSITGTVYKGVNTTLTVTVGTAGKVRFLWKGKKIPKCLSVSTTGTYPNFTATCTWKAPVTGQQYLSYNFTPTDNTFSAASESPLYYLWVVKRTTNR